jgi:hypothetical protein
MKTCEYQKHLPAYITDELSPVIKHQLEAHFSLCLSCREKVQQLQKIHEALSFRARPLPSAKLLEKYRQDLRKNFSTGFSWEEALNKVNNFISRYLIHPSPRLRLTEIVSFVLVGIFIGWFLFYSSDKVSPTSVKPLPHQRFLPIYGLDLEFINKFLLQSEMLILDLINGTEIDFKNVDNLKEIKNSAQILLIMSFQIHEIALQKNQTQILSLLTELEMVLYEISNISVDEVEKTFPFIRQIITESDLLKEIESIQMLLEDSVIKVEKNV